jgi:DNA-binding transcriptional MerR regulator
MTPLSTDDFPYTIAYVSELLAVDEPQLMVLVSTLGLNPKQDTETGRILFTHRELDQLKKAAELQRHGDDLDTIGRHLKTDSPSTSEESRHPQSSATPRSTLSSIIPGASLLTTPPSVSDEDRKESSRHPAGHYQPNLERPGVLLPDESRPNARKSSQTMPARPGLDLPGGKGLHSGTVIASSSIDSSRSNSRLSGSSSEAGAADSITMMIEAVSQVKEGILKDLGRLLDDKLSGLDEVVVELIRCKSENDSLKKKLIEAVQAREALELEVGRFKPVQFGFYRKL